MSNVGDIIWGMIIGWVFLLLIAMAIAQIKAKHQVKQRGRSAKIIFISPKRARTT